jgi:hypothetical protein
MKARTAIRAGKSGCSPEAQYYMEKAIQMENQINRCLANAVYQPVTPPTGAVPPTMGYVYPDRSGWCG